MLAGLVILAGCDFEDFADSQRYTEDFHHTYELKSGGRLSVENFNGPVEIYGWDKNQVEIHGTKYASTKDNLATLKVEISNSPDSVSIRTLRPDGSMRRGNMGAKYRVHVPSKTALERVVTSNGPLRVDQMEGGGRLRTSNGPVRLFKFRGDIEVDTSNGPVELTDFSGAAVLHTSNGPVSASGVKGRLEVTTSNGPVNVALTEADLNRPVKLRTSNGPVTLRLEGVKGAEVSAVTSNGPITVKLGPGTGARVKAATSNASVSTDFSLSNVVTQSKTKLDGTIGSGGPLLDLTTSNGSIRILKN